jgi:glycosyltransferase involved in cell wall biosynthesis
VRAVFFSPSSGVIISTVEFTRALPNAMPSESPRVSICIPTYNGGNYLAETLDCVAAQTFDDYEVVIVDDGSADDTVMIAERYVATEPRARLIRNAVRAGSSARNLKRCVEESRGEWIKPLQQDDVISPDCLARMVDAGARGPLVFAHHGYVFSPNTDDGVRHYYESLPTLGAELPVPFATADSACAAFMRNPWTNFIGSWSTSLIHRTCLEKYGPFHKTIIYFPDLEYWMRVGTNEGMSIVPERLSHYRVHGQSISARLRGDPLNEYRSGLDLALLVYSVARDPQYARFREFAQRWDPPFDAEGAFMERLLDWRWEALELSHRKGDPARLRTFNAFCDQNPALRSVLRDHDRRLPAWQRFKHFVKARV